METTLSAVLGALLGLTGMFLGWRLRAVSKERDLLRRVVNRRLIDRVKDRAARKEEQ